MNIDWVDPSEVEELLLGKTIVAVHVHTDFDDNSGISWIGLTLSDGTELELGAHGEHTEGWIEIERGRRIRDIYGIQA